MNYTIKTVEVRKFTRINRINGIKDTVTVSNRNDLTIEDQLRLMNANDKDYLYEVLNDKV